MRYIGFGVISIILHVLLIFISPNIPRMEVEKLTVEFQPVSRHADISELTEPKPTQEAQRPVSGPIAEPEPEPTPESLPDNTEPVEAPQEPIEAVIPEEIISENAAESPKNNEDSAETEDEEGANSVELAEEAPEETQMAELEPMPEPEPEPELRDGRVEVPLVQTFVSDRIRGQIEFKGKGRTIVNIPQSFDFSLTNNTSVQLNFKIDSVGTPYDIEMPPVPRDIERALTDFVLRMRFSAVLYDEPDSAGMKVDLQVR